MSDEQKHACAAQVLSNYAQYSCGRAAAHEHKGKYFCKMHHPPTAQAKRMAKQAAFEERLKTGREKDAAVQAAADEVARRADSEALAFREALLVVKAQADDEALWCGAATATEAYLQQALRRLHVVMEGER